MIDPRFEVLAEVLIGFSTKLKKGERVLIDAFDAPPEMVIALIRSARSKGAFPFVNLQSNAIHRELLRGAEEDQYRVLAEFEMSRMKAMDAYVALRGSHNTTEFSDVAPERMKLAMKLLQPVVEQRVNKTKWVVLRWPTPAMAQMAGMSTEAFEDLFFKVCTLDYSKMNPGMEALKSQMEKTDQVQIIGPGTDLRFSIKGIPAILNSDEGARFIGEFALGFNPYIREPMRDILFDEKIAGSFHFTPGQAYEHADNGNRSQVHWDLVCIQRPEYGGGEIYFDRKLLRKDGLFIPKDIQALNPEHLAGANAE